MFRTHISNIEYVPDILDEYRTKTEHYIMYRVFYVHVLTTENNDKNNINEYI